MDFFNRIFRRRPEAEEVAASGCHICGMPAQYHCDMCGKLVCSQHTVTGTATCTSCHEAARAYVNRR